MNSMGDQSGRGNLRRPLTAQELIDSQTMKINNPNIMGSGFIQHPPQVPFQQPIVYQPPSVAHLEYPQEYMDKNKTNAGGVPRPEGGQAEPISADVGRQAGTQEYEVRQNQNRKFAGVQEVVEPQRNVQDEAKFYDQKSNYISDEYLEPLVRARLGMDSGNQHQQGMQNGGRNGEYPVRLKEVETVIPANARTGGFSEQQQFSRPPSYGQPSVQQKIHEPVPQPNVTRLPPGFQSGQRAVPQDQVLAPSRVATTLQSPAQRRIPEVVQRQPVYSNAQMARKPSQPQRQQPLYNNVPVAQRREVEPQRQQPVYSNAQQVQRRIQEVQGQQPVGSNTLTTQRTVQPNRQQQVYSNTQVQRKDPQFQKQQVSNPSNGVQQLSLKQQPLNNSIRPTSTPTPAPQSNGQVLVNPVEQAQAQVAQKMVPGMSTNTPKLSKSAAKRQRKKLREQHMGTKALS